MTVKRWSLNRHGDKGHDGMNLRTVLVIGSGGREHALAWALARSPQVGQVYVAPGNGGTTWPATQSPVKLAPCTNVDIPVDNFPALIRFAHEHAVDLTVIGPDNPLAEGIVDAFNGAKLRVFGPTREVARLESSKAHAKAIMAECGIPTAQYKTFVVYESARQFLIAFNRPVVVKADGLAAGKGVIVCEDFEEADAALRRLLIDGEFGAASKTVLIEERLTGPEVSVLAFTDGQTVVPMPPARDHKRIYEGDTGPNTGGMGAYAPVPDLNAAQLDELCRTVLQPVIDAVARRGTKYVGVLYAGLMLTADGPKVLEYNCRFGDPETQVILPLLESDLWEVMLACIEGRLDRTEVRWRSEACATVVLASPGYPGTYPVGLPISGELDARDDLIIFHAGTAVKDSQLVTAGGRVMAVTALGKDLPAALDTAFGRVNQVHFEGMNYRRDIGRAFETAK